MWNRIICISYTLNISMHLYLSHDTWKVGPLKDDSFHAFHHHLGNQGMQRFITLYCACEKCVIVFSMLCRCE